MAIQVECECGKRLRVKEALGGKRVRCPDCGETLEVRAGGAFDALDEFTRPSSRRGRPDVDDEDRDDAELEDDDEDAESAPRRNKSTRREADEEEDAEDDGGRKLPVGRIVALGATWAAALGAIALGIYAGIQHPFMFAFCMLLSVFIVFYAANYQFARKPVNKVGDFILGVTFGWIWSAGKAAASVAAKELTKGSDPDKPSRPWLPVVPTLSIAVILAALMTLPLGLFDGSPAAPRITVTQPGKPGGTSSPAGGTPSTPNPASQRNGKLVHELAGHSEHVKAMVFSPDGRKLFSTDQDRTLRLWDLERGSVIHTFTGHTGPIHGIAVAPDGKRGLSCAGDGAVIIWDLDKGGEADRLADLPLAPHCAAFSPDGRYLYVGDVNGVSAWDLATHKQVLRFEEGKRTTALAVSPDGSLVFTSTLTLYDAATGKVQKQLTAFDGQPADNVSFVKDGRSMIAGSAAKQRVHAWDFSMGSSSSALNLKLSTTGELVDRFGFGKDTRRFMVGSNHGFVICWNWNGQEVRTLTRFRAEPRAATAVALSPNGRVAAAAGSDNVIRLWELPP